MTNARRSTGQLSDRAHARVCGADLRSLDAFDRPVEAPRRKCAAMKTRRFLLVPASALIGCLTAVVFFTGASALPGITERVSVDSTGVEANDASSIPAISS